MFPSESESVNSVTELLIARTQQFGDRALYTFLKDGDPAGATDSYSFAELDTRARQIASILQSSGLAGERVLLVYPPGIEFIAGFFGCLYAGAVAVPTVAPHPARPEKSLPRLCTVAQEARAAAVLTTAPLQVALERQVAETGGVQKMRWLTAADWAARDSTLWRAPSLRQDGLAFLQFTSGSTGSPRGVMLSHGNLLANLRIIGQGFAIRSTDCGVHWLPFYHDMGLIGGILETLYGGAHSVFLSPMHFLQRPLRWLRAISHFGGNISGGPDFAYRLCVERATPEAIRELDLTSWRVAFTGAEPVSAATVRQFCETFASAGFRAASVYPCFGLAESTLLVAGGTADTPPSFSKTDAQGRSRELVGSGKAGAGHQLRIVDPETLRLCPANTVGEIWVHGPSVALGYWDRAELTAATFHAHLEEDADTDYLRTGDLGFLDEQGELFVVGRLKDLIIVRGRNHYPHDLERTAESAHAAIRSSSVAAFGIDLDQQEQVVVVCEVKAGAGPELLQEMASSIRAKIADEHEIPVREVVFARPGAIGKTSSGKIQRSRCRQEYLAGQLDEIVRVGLRTENAVKADGALEQRILELTARQLDLTADAIDPTTSFASYGVDSLRAVAISGMLERETGRELSPALLYNYPTPRLLAEFLSGEDASSQKRTHRAGAPIAIVGMSCRFPGGANDPDSFWRLLLAGVDAVSTVPPDRVWPEDKPRWGGWLQDIDKFDAAAFGIAAREAAGIDPQQRLLLEVAAEAIEDAGMPPESLAGKPVGVFVGVSSSDYASWCLQHSPVDAWSGTGNAHSICANRLSYVLDLRGPSMAIDTACSSSLVAVHQACASLRAGETSMALVGGVNVVITTHTSEAFAFARMLAPDGRCKTFDASADGYVRGEGCGVVVLKPLADAERDGDRVIAVIRGTAVNQDGRSNGLTAPNGEAQRRVIEAALSDAGVQPAAIGYVEAHGTGTPLGDPIELDALGRVLGKRDEGERCVVGAVKTNIGHLEPASGIASLIKAALMVERGAIPPHLHLRKVNPAVDLTQAPYRFPAAVEPWPAASEQRLAGVNSFGFGGANAHVILSGAPHAPRVAPLDSNVHVLTLSARSEPLLKELALRFAAMLERDSDVSFADVARSASLGRTQREFRLAVLATGASEAASALRRYSEGLSSASVRAGHRAPGAAPAVEFFCPDLGSGQQTRRALLTQLAEAAQLRSWGVLPSRIRSAGTGVATAAVLGGIVSKEEAEQHLNTGSPLPASWRQLAATLPVAGACSLTLTSDSEDPAGSLRSKLADLFIAGISIDWAAVYGNNSIPKIALPFSPFERVSYWKGPKGTPNTEAPRTTVQTVEVGLGSHPYLRDHRVFDQVVTPAAWYVDQVARIAQQHFISRAVTVRDLRLLRPLPLPASGEARKVEFTIRASTGSVSVTALLAGADEILFEATLDGTAFDQPTPAIPRMLDSTTAPMSHEEFFQLMTAAGLHYGPGFRWPCDVYRKPGFAETRLTHKSSLNGVNAAFLHPGALDAMFQLIGGAVENLEREPEAWVPISVGSVRVFGIGAECAWAQAEAAREPGGFVSGTARMLDSRGRTLVQVDGVRLTRLSRNQKLQPQSGPSFHSVQWVPLDAEQNGTAGFIGRRVLVIGDGHTADRAATSLRLHGYEVGVRGRNVAPEELAAIPADVVVSCWPASLPLDSTAADRAKQNIVETALLAKALVAAGGVAPALCAITCGAQFADAQDPIPDPALGALSGLCRTIAAECPELRCGVVELDPFAPDPFAALGAAIESLQRSGEVMLAVRRGVHLVQRMQPVEKQQTVRGSRALSMASRGVLDKLTLVARARRAPAAGEVEIEICAAALNFRDVLQALDMIPGYGVFGGECAGRVVRVGPDAGDLNPGDEVVAALASEGCAADFVTLPASHVILKPEGLSFAAAAAVPMAFMTALYGLRDIARLKPGDTLLVHAGAGGVGFAALQIAVRMGVRVFATAGSPEKRAFVRQMGAFEVFDSRTLDFSAAVLESTGGRGVDAVLNSLAGPFIPSSMDCLRPGGFFLELGKRELCSPERLRAENRNLEYRPYDLIALSTDNPALFRRLFEETISDVASGALAAPPLRAFPMSDASAAFRFMAQARHIGKIVLLPEGGSDSAPIRPRCSYLITGGTGALGLSAAERLASMGAERILLMARRKPGESVRKRVQAIAESGTEVEIIQADVTDLEETRAALSRIDTSGAPLRGIVHCAGVLDDGMLRSLDAGRIEGVLAPKTDGAWNLHRLTQNRALDFFVLYSSAAAVFGNRGQAAYSAGNAFLDSLAEMRRASGLAASSIAWGPWEGAGMADTAVSRSLAASAGITPLATPEALDVLEDVLRTRPVRRVAVRFEAARLASHLGRNAKLLARLEGAAQAAQASDIGAASKSAALKLDGDPAQRRARLSAFLEDKIRACLDLGRDVALDPQAELADLGLDSLMSVELRSAVLTDLGYEIPETVLAGGLSLEKLTAHLMAALVPEGASRNGAAPHTKAEDGHQGAPGHAVEKFWSRMQPTLDRVAFARSLNLYHFEKPIASYDGGAWVRCADGERRLMLATHCYLGLLSHPYIKRRVLEAVEEFGGGVHGSRLMGGCLQLHQQLERKIADFNGREAAMAISTGYATNSSVIPALVGPGDWVISDQLNHASILDGCNASGALVRVYKHNNVEDLEQVLKAAPSRAVKLVVADGVFSMDGDIADLPGLSALCRQYGALLMIDEAHSLGVLGKTGRGIEEHFGMPGSVDILMGTLSKTLSSMGGYITGSNRLIDYLRLTARGYFFSTSPAAPVVAASLAALEVMEEEGEALCGRLHRNTAMFIEGLRAAGFDTGASTTAIVPAILGSDEKAARLADYGQRNGLFVLPALPPAVPVGTARLRLTVSAAHTPDDLSYALDILAEGARKLQYASIAIATA